MLNPEEELARVRLINAVCDGNLSEVNCIILRLGGRAAVVVNAPGGLGDTALITAVEYNHITIVQVLLAVPGIHVNARGRDGYTALMYAAEFGYDDIVQALLAFPGINLEAVNFEQMTAAAIDEQREEWEIYNLITSAISARLTPLEENARDRLINAARTNNLSAVTSIISHLGERAAVVVNAADLSGDTALIWAARNRHITIVRVLLTVRGIDVNAANQIGDTALIIATELGDVAIFQDLLAAPGIDVNAADLDGVTVLMQAVCDGNIEFVSALVAYPGIDLDAEEFGHLTAAAIAQRQGFQEIHNLITTAIHDRLASRVAAAAPAPAPAPAVIASVENAHQAARSGNLVVIQHYLRANRGDHDAINVIDDNGDTLLHLAAMHGRADIVDELIREQAVDLTIQNVNHRTAAAEAEQNSFFDIASQLVTIMAQRESSQAPAAAMMIADNQSADSLMLTDQSEPGFAERLANIPDFDEASIPIECIDPISREIMESPITVKSGYTYERGSLTSYFQSKGNPKQIYCPATRFYIDIDELNNNTSVVIYNWIEKFVSKQERKYKQRQEQEKTLAATAAAVVAASNVNVTDENKSSDEAMPDTEKLRTTRLKMFGNTLPASHSASSLAAQPAAQDNEVVVGRRL